MSLKQVKEVVYTESVLFVYRLTMKYIRKVSDINLAIKKIVGEIVNITYGSTYYTSDGELVDKPIPRHNSFKVGSIRYDITPNSGVIFIITDNKETRSKITLAIEEKFWSMVNDADRKFGRLQLPVGITGTTQYMIISDSAVNDKHKVSFFHDTVLPVTSQYNFGWLIYPERFYPYISGYEQEKDIALQSLTSIIYDDKEIITLPDGTFSCDYPTVKDYILYNRPNFTVEKIILSVQFGLVYEIADLYNAEKLDTKHTAYGQINRPITYVKWNQFKLYERNFDINFISFIPFNCR